MFGVVLGSILGDDESKKKHAQDEFKRIFGFEPHEFDRSKHYGMMKEKLLFLKSSTEFFELNRAIEAAVTCEHGEVIAEVLAGIPNPELVEQPTL
jgi:hypothetical protein